MLHFTTNNNKAGLIIFVHGFIGGMNTWVRDDGKKSILDYLKNEDDIVKDFDFAIFDYFTKITDLFDKLAWFLSLFGAKLKLRKNIPVDVIGSLLESEIKIKCKNYKCIVLIAHSMGGLVSKSYILDEIKANRPLKVKLFISLSVPHRGAELAIYAKLIFKNPHINDLNPLNKTINTLNDSWVKASNVPRIVYFRGTSDVIVSLYSSVGIEKDEANIINAEHDHFSIVTPDSKEDIVIYTIREELRELLEPSLTDNGQPTNHKPVKSLRFLTRGPNKVQLEIDTFRKKYLEALNHELSLFELFTRQIKDNATGIIYDSDNIAEHVENSGLNVFWGIGGLGKSILLKRISRKLTELNPNSVTIFCDGKKWAPGYGSSINKTLPTHIKLNNILNAFRSDISIEDLKTVKASKDNPKLKKYLFLDGLNEISDNSLRSEIVEALYDIHKNYGFNIYIANRYFSPLDFSGWRFFELEKLPPRHLTPILEAYFGQRTASYTEKILEYLALPYFLNIAITDRNDDIKSYSGYLHQHTFKNLEESRRTVALTELSELAFTAYQSNQKFIIPENNLSRASVDLYLQSGILIKIEGGFKFEHHLVNEYFVAHRISGNRELWRREMFDLITLENKIAFEIIQMTLEQITDTSQTDQFLLAVYNWNFYAALNCLKNVDDKFTTQTAVSMILVLTEKLFDRFNHTKVKVAGYLKPLYVKFNIKGIDANMFSGDIIQKTSTKDNKEDFYKILHLNQAYFEEGEYKTWYDIFSNNSVTTTDYLIDQMSSANPVIGWSFANIIKRSPYSDLVENAMILKYRDTEDPIVKWRIVHALGKARSENAIGFLLDCLTNNRSYLWVRYGAVRSLFEILIFQLDKHNAEELIDKLILIYEKGNLDKLIANEFRSCFATKIEAYKKDIFTRAFEKITVHHRNAPSEMKLWEITKKSFYELNNPR